MGTRYYVQVRHVSGPPTAVSANGLWTYQSTDDLVAAESLAATLRTPPELARLAKALDEDDFTEGHDHRVIDVFVQPADNPRSVELVAHVPSGQVLTEQYQLTDDQVPPEIRAEAVGAPNTVLQRKFVLRPGQDDLTAPYFHYDAE